MQLPVNFESEKDTFVDMVKTIDGHLTDKEMHFLFIVGAIKTSTGDILEIGSYKGRSTILLSKAAEFAGNTMLYAVDPLTLPSETDPNNNGNNTKNEFYSNIKKHNAKLIFNEMLSQDLAKQWDKPLRFLWIDGDHTFKGAQIDFLGFAKFLVPGGIIGFHDVLNGHTGPLQVFAQEVLLNSKFGACGVVGSIGWAQFIGDKENHYLNEKETLYIKLIKMLPHIIKKKRSRFDKIFFKLKRSQVPHQKITAHDFLEKIDQL
jgi:hypothetical protein